MRVYKGYFFEYFVKRNNPSLACFSSLLLFSHAAVGAVSARTVVVAAAVFWDATTRFAELDSQHINTRLRIKFVAPRLQENGAHAIGSTAKASLLELHFDARISHFLELDRSPNDDSPRFLTFLSLLSPDISLSTFYFWIFGTHCAIINHLLHNCTPRTFNQSSVLIFCMDDFKK